MPKPIYNSTVHGPDIQVFDFNEPDLEEIYQAIESPRPEPMTIDPVVVGLESVDDNYNSRHQIPRAPTDMLTS